MRKHLLNLYRLSFLLLLALPAWSAPTRVVYNKGERPHHVKLLKEILEHTKDMGPYELQASDTTFGSSRLIDEVADNGGGANILTRAPATSEKEMERLLPIRIPLDKGLLGYRILLVRKQDLPKFAAVNSVEDLKKFRMGQGSHWVDATVLEKAGFNVIGGYYPAGLRRMLNEDRFDMIARAIWEAPKELEEVAKDMPDLAVEPTLVLHYPFARYFWVSRKGDGPDLARRIETGLRRIMANGTFDRLFDEFYGAFVEQTNLRSRRVFEAGNALLPPDTPLDDKSLWFNMRSPENASEPPAKKKKQK